jgi:hypothetical protein
MVQNVKKLFRRSRLQRCNTRGCSDATHAVAATQTAALFPTERRAVAASLRCRGGDAPLRLDDKRVVHHEHVALTRLVPSRSGAHGGTRGVLEGYSQETLGVLEGYSQGYSQGTRGVLTGYSRDTHQNLGFSRKRSHSASSDVRCLTIFSADISLW